MLRANERRFKFTKFRWPNMMKMTWKQNHDFDVTQQVMCLNRKDLREIITPLLLRQHVSSKCSFSLIPTRNLY
jgi:hypothetical protein